jgi:hypothetical protein
MLSHVWVTYRRGMDRMIGLIDTLCIQFGTTDNYSAIAILHTLQFTAAHTHTHVLSLH